LQNQQEAVLKNSGYKLLKTELSQNFLVLRQWFKKAQSLFNPGYGFFY